MKTKIAALITALLIIFIGAGGVYYISQTSPQIKGVVDSNDQTEPEELPVNQSVRYIETPVDTKVEDWLKLIGQEFNLSMINVSDGSFVWITEIGEEELFGQAIILDGSLDVSKDALVEVFERNGFEENPDQLGGFIKKDLVCLMKTFAKDVNIEVRCSLINLEKNIVKKLILEKRPLLEKDDGDSPTILIDIIQSTTDHISGNVQFIGPDEEESTPEQAQNGMGTFLVAKDVDGEWLLVFEGNEKILCSVVEPYHFPVEMLPECFDETTNEMINRTQ